MRKKKVELTALGFMTDEKPTVCAPVGAATLGVFFRRNDPVTVESTVQPEASPKFVGWAVKVELLAEKPIGVVHMPLAVVQAVKSADLITVADGTVKVKAYVVLVLATELPITTELLLIGAAEATLGINANSNTNEDKTQKSLFKKFILSFIFRTISPSLLYYYNFLYLLAIIA